MHRLMAEIEVTLPGGEDMLLVYGTLCASPAVVLFTVAYVSIWSRRRPRPLSVAAGGGALRGAIIGAVVVTSLPLIFTGLRLSLGVGWMVLIAAEMLAQNPGLGKFVWDEFQNGSSDSLSRIMVAVFTIGLIGFALDRAMLALHRLVDFGSKR